MSRRYSAWSLLAAVLLSGGAWASAVDVTVSEDSGQRIVLDYSFETFTRGVVRIEGEPWMTLALGKESLKHRAGDPALPDVSRSVIIPDNARMAVRVIDGDYYEISGVNVAPSKGVILRTEDPDSVPYTFSPVYRQDAFWPAELAELGRPYIMRDQRGIVVTVNPFQYNPATRVLRVYTSMSVEVTADGVSQVNVPNRSFQRKLNGSFHDIYSDHFLNYDLDSRYNPLDEDGDMLIICHDAWTTNVQSLADHKTSIGIATTVVPVSTIGNNATAIASYIQNLYDISDLAFVLLVGDAAQVATPSSSGGSSDPSYAKVAGGDDYPDIFIGRFSAESAADVDTQVLRTIEYEENQATMESWFWKGLGIASDEGAGIGDEGQSDDQHMAEIRTWLLGGGYTEVGELYGYSTTPAQVATALNDGRGIINYCGHGSTTSWASTGFSNSDVNALTNDNELPFIISVACVNGQFDGYTCFGETWLRATNGTEPTGAVGIYCSSINQSWAPPMEGQDEFNLRYLAGTYNTYGALCFAGSCSMMDDYGSDGVAMFDTWHVFGDPSLRIVGTTAPPTGMKVGPGGGLVAEGANGGPFTPGSLDYTLTNYEAFAIDYTVSESTSWLDISTTGGTIPAMGTATVTVSINASANSLGNGYYTGDVDFVNTTNHDGDTTRTCSLTVGVPEMQYEWTMNADPGWTTTGQWAFGVPTGGGGIDHGYPDPTSGATGSKVYGINLFGDYSDAVGNWEYLTTGAIDCSTLHDVSVRFQRWLNSDYQSYVYQTLEVSANGSNWSPVWDNGDDEITDNGWSERAYDISAVADGQPTVYLRWGHAVLGSYAWAYSGWNVDDVAIWGVGDTTQTGTGFCFGDPGDGTPCPCNNDNDGSVPGSGCANGVFTSGARLSGTGVASLTADTLRLATTGLEPSNSGLYFQANNDLSPGIIWGDGLQCAGGNLKRLGVRFANAAGYSDTSGYTQPISVKAGNILAGDTKYYQCWYRNPTSSPCGSEFNASNGLAVTWAP